MMRRRFEKTTMNVVVVVSNSAIDVVVSFDTA